MRVSGHDYREVDDATAQRANRGDWDRTADDYQREHGDFLRDVGFVWSPEGLDEADVHLLGDVAGRRVLEVGCGAGQCGRWLTAAGARTVGIDLSLRQLQHSRRIDGESGIHLPTACATVTALPIADASVDLACSAFGALPFVVDVVSAFREVRRVLRAGGTFVCSLPHPVAWIFPDDPTVAGLTVSRSYFDRRSYVELDEAGRPSYAEPHHTVGDWIAAAVAARFVVRRLLEPAWPEGHERVWSGWGPDRGRLVPGTLILDLLAA